LEASGLGRKLLCGAGAAVPIGAADLTLGEVEGCVKGDGAEAAGSPNGRAADGVEGVASGALEDKEAPKEAPKLNGCGAVVASACFGAGAGARAVLADGAMLKAGGAVETTGAGVEGAAATAGAGAGGSVRSVAEVAKDV
jgi:hypothetical protein